MAPQACAQQTAPTARPFHCALLLHPSELGSFYMASARPCSAPCTAWLCAPKCWHALVHCLSPPCQRWRAAVPSAACPGQPSGSGPAHGGQPQPHVRFRRAAAISMRKVRMPLPMYGSEAKAKAAAALAPWLLGASWLRQQPAAPRAVVPSASCPSNQRTLTAWPIISSLACSLAAVTLASSSAKPSSEMAKLCKTWVV